MRAKTPLPLLLSAAFLGVAGLLSSCGASAPVRIGQGERSWDLHPGNLARITLAERSLSISLGLRPYDAAAGAFHGLALIATTDTAILGTTRTGVSTEVAGRFAPGSAFAAVEERGWPILGEDGFNFLYFDPLDPSRSPLRAGGPPSERGDYELSLTVAGFFTDGRLVALESWGQRPLALVMHVDRNLDGTIGRDELYEALLTFE